MRVQWRIQDLTSSPAWVCFRADLRRHWRPKSIWIFALLSALGLLPLAMSAFVGGFGSPSGPQVWVIVILAIPWIAVHFLMPAYAAGSIAPDRQQHRLQDLILAGLTARQIFFAKGLASLLPFLLLALGAFIAAVLLALETFIAVVLGYVPALSIIRSSNWIEAAFGADQMFGSGNMPLLLALLTAPFFFLAQAGILLCVSALCCRTWTATAICYAVTWLGLPTAAWVILISGFGDPYIDIEVGAYLGTLLFEWAVLALLFPRALRALRYPDEEKAA